jgi:hypothetical protein
MLTVVIAVGAIWAAFASTRQAQFSRRLASAAERNVGEQIRSFREQNERARLQEERAVLSFEVDMLFKLEDRINGQRLENTKEGPPSTSKTTSSQAMAACWRCSTCTPIPFGYSPSSKK